MDRIYVAVIDTGIDFMYDRGEVDFDTGIGISLEEGGFVHTDNIVDTIGHGTAVASMIHQSFNDAVVIPIKVMDDSLCTADYLYEALQYIYDHIECDLIHISLGITCCEDKKSLYEICKKLDEKGIIIVSALDNRGLISYPASFDCVIGVDSNPKWHKSSDYTIVENSEINIVGYCSEQRVAWKGHTTRMVSGSSFTAAFFTGKIAQILLEYGALNRQTILHILEKGARRHIKIKDIDATEIPFPISKAVVFPFNKEIHSLVRFHSMLKMSDIEFYDTKYTGQVGKKLANWAWESENIDGVIKNIDQLDWSSDFDTFILGHIQELENILQRSYVEYIAEQCYRFHKKLYTFFDIENRLSSELKGKLTYFYPKVPTLKTKKPSYKMYELDTPVICIVGTHSRQGKFTVQLILRSAFQNAGYRVGQLGTEPSSLLFDMDAVYPMGYESSVYVSGPDAVYAVNRIMGDIQTKDPDIIITGTQGIVHTLHPSGYNASTTAVHEFLLGCQADAYILCISYADEIEDIRTTIRYLRSVYDADVIGIVLSPMAQDSKWSIINNNINRVNAVALETYRQKISEALSMPVFVLNQSEEGNKLMNLCIDYFSV